MPPGAPQPTDPPPSEGGAWLDLGRGRRVRADDVEITFSASPGPGGQNVNKRATKAQLRVSVDRLPLGEQARDRLRRLAGTRLTREDEVLLTCGVHRHARRNQAECVARLAELVHEAARAPKIRRPTRPGRGAKERRLQAKREHKDKKIARRWKPDD